MTAQNVIKGLSEGLTKGHSRSDVVRLYGRWHAMKRRCHSPTSHAYERYGGRGIVVCDRWRNSFTNFVADMGWPLAGQSVERVDNDGPYSLENCVWANTATQNRNTRQNRYVEVNGARMVWTDALARHGDERLTFEAFYSRIKIGWPFSMALIVAAPLPGRRVLGYRETLYSSCRRGHAFTVENTRINRNGSRVCITCLRVREKNRNRRAM